MIKDITNTIMTFLENDKGVKKHVSSHWISGSTTLVYPIATWIHDDENATIRVQWNSRNKNTSKPILKRVDEAFGKYVKCSYLSVYDGSCPNELVIVVEI